MSRCSSCISTRRGAFAAVLGSLVFALVSMGCASKPVLDEELPAAEILYQRGLDQLANGGRVLWVFPSSDTTKAIETFQQIVDNYPYSDLAVMAELKIADAYFADEKYEEALSYYRDFSELHPNHESVPYTLLQAGRCHVEQSRTANRDQTSARHAVGFLDKLIASHPGSPEASEGRRLQAEMRTKLGEHEIGIADFYFGRDEWQAAADRYRAVIERYAGLGFDETARERLAACYVEMNLPDEAKRVLDTPAQPRSGTDVATGGAEPTASAQ